MSLVFPQQFSTSESVIPETDPQLISSTLIALLIDYGITFPAEKCSRDNKGPLNYRNIATKISELTNDAY